MAKTQFFELGKSLKLPKIQFHEKNYIKKIRESDSFDFTSFLRGLF